MDDDKKLKIIFYLIIFLSAVAIIGIWEFFIKALFFLLIDSITIST
ncbi:MAG TPA: hypothetical protein PKL09_03450 [bacterium]|nr:hypothetical protein [bacterium]HNS34357.1 hypothetical protein [bacterium]HNZ73769.1 hypothetical protein [bacterium]HOH67684.1 hypothetical protein [bacterium]